MIRFYNGKVLSFGGGLKISDAEVWTDGNTISYVGPKKEDMPVFEREIDLKGDLLMPGFKNAHTHTPMTFLRSYAEDLPLHRWLSEKVWPNEAKLSDDDVYYLTQLGIMDYLAGGTTATFDMYSHNEPYANANIDSGFRTVICSAMNDFDRDIEDIERSYLKYNRFHELVSYRLGFHAEYTTSMERMKYLVGLLEKYREPAFVHLSETKSEVDGCLERYGLTPPLFLDSIGMFQYGGGGFHCVWMSDDDIDLFAGKGLWAITNPASNLKLASGIAPICRMDKAGVKLAIGTDSAASNNALDMFREMFLVSVLQKYSNNDAASCSAERVLEMACVGGARAMGLNSCDDIAVGKLADMTVIDLHYPNMQPVNDLAANLVFAGGRENVRLTMVNGKIRFENGEFFIGEEPERIYAKANAFMRRIRE